MLLKPKPWALGLLCANVAATILIPLTELSLNHLPSGRELWNSMAYSIAYGNSIAIPAVLVMPPLVAFLARRRVPLIPVIVACSIAFAALGCFIGESLVVWIGSAPPAYFWPDFSQTFRYTALLAVVFGLGSFFYQSVRTELQQTATKLHERELSEAHAHKLAAEARLTSLESRLHPHFLFNTLNSISSLIPSDPQRAEQILSRFAALLRSLLDSTQHSLVSLDEELTLVQDYIAIEQARFGPNLRTRIDAPAELRNARVPPLSVQSLVENAVKHGIAPQRAGGEIVVRASLSNGTLHVEVSDTGPGFDLTAIPPEHGLDNLVERLEALFGSMAHLSVHRVDGRCVVEMILPRS